MIYTFLKFLSINHMAIGYSYTKFELNWTIFKAYTYNNRNPIFNMVLANNKQLLNNLCKRYLKFGIKIE